MNYAKTDDFFENGFNFNYSAEIAFESEKAADFLCPPPLLDLPVRSAPMAQMQNSECKIQNDLMIQSAISVKFRSQILHFALCILHFAFNQHRRLFLFSC